MTAKFKNSLIFRSKLCNRNVEEIKYFQHCLIALFGAFRKAEQSNPIIICICADIGEELEIRDFKFELLKQLSSTRDMHCDFVRRGYCSACSSDNAVDRISFNSALTGPHRNEMKLHPQVVQSAAQHNSVSTDLIASHLVVSAVLHPCDVADRYHCYDGRTCLSYGCGRRYPRRCLVCRQVGRRPGTPSESGCRSGNGADYGYGNVRHEVRHALDLAAILEPRQGGAP